MSGIKQSDVSANLSQQNIEEPVATLSTNQYANVNEPENIAVNFDLIELSPLKNARFSQKRQDSAETCTDIPKSDSNHHFSNSREDTSFLNPVKCVKNDGIVGDDFLEGFSPATPDVDNDQDVFVDASENILKTGEPLQKNQENEIVLQPTLAETLHEGGSTSVNQSIVGVVSICGRYAVTAGQYLPDDTSELKSNISVIAEEDEYDHLQFEAPAAKSDEEIEDQLFKGECKLYNYCCVTKQSSEIGMGDIFVLYNFKKNLYQVCMRRHRDQKICAYLKIREDTILNDKKGCKSSGVLQCQDFSEGESKPAIFIVRFREKNVYDEFKKIFDDATENVRMSLINGGTVDECSRKLKEAKQTGVPFKRQRTPQSCNTIDDSFMSVASATFKAPATPPKSFATFTSVNAETCFSSQFPSATKAASAHVLPPRRPENVANVSNTTLKSHYADDEPVAVPVEPRNAFANLSQQKLDESVATLSTNQYANVNEPQNIALTFDLIELSPLKNARFSQKRQDSAETCTDIPKSDSNHHFSNSREDTSFLNPVKGVKNDGIVGDDFLEGFSPATPDVDNDQDVFVDAFENVLKTDEPHQKNQENKTVSNPTHAKLMDNLLPECGNTTVNQGIDGVNSICGRYDVTAGQYLPDDNSELKSNISVIAEEDEYDHLQFEAPAAKSDEEIEDQLFKGECKLFNYCCVTKQTSEIGMGDIFIVYNFKNNLYQVLMRRHRDQKICAYLKIREDTILNDKKGCKNSGVLQCQDFSEGESKPAIFIVRFREKDVYEEFKKIFNDATENFRMSIINGGTVDESLRKLKEAKQTGVPFKRQRTPQSCNTIDNSFMSVASTTFKAPATPPKSFATFTSVNAETSFSSQFPSATKAAYAPVSPPRRPLSENVANVNELHNYAATFDLLQLSPLKNARFSQRRQDNAKTSTDIPLCGSSQFPPYAKAAYAPVPPPRRYPSENASKRTLTSDFADDEVVAGDFSKLSVC